VSLLKRNTAVQWAIWLFPLPSLLTAYLQTERRTHPNFRMAGKNFRVYRG
jgi:hypothetical protein